MDLTSLARKTLGTCLMLGNLIQLIHQQIDDSRYHRIIYTSNLSSFTRMPTFFCSRGDLTGIYLSLFSPLAFGIEGFSYFFPGCEDAQQSAVE